MIPELGDRVHYVAAGSPVRDDGTQLYPSVCRAAFVTEIPPQVPEGPDRVSLLVMNPTGIHVPQAVAYDPAFAPATWHTPCDHHRED